MGGALSEPDTVDLPALPQQQIVRVTDGQATRSQELENDGKLRNVGCSP